MEAKELRIGNIIRVGNTLHRVGEIHRSHILVPPFREAPWTSYPLSMVESVPFDAEWAKKLKVDLYEDLSMQMDEISGSVGQYPGIGSLGGDYEYVISRESNGDGWPCYVTEHFRSVHELQNLFWVLRKEEIGQDILL